MRTKESIVVFLLGVSCLTINAQSYRDFDLSIYKTPDIVRNELDFSLSSAGNFWDQNSSDQDSYRINGYFNSAFNRYKNTRSFIGKHEAKVNLGGSYNKNSGVKQTSYDLSGEYMNRSRFYYTNQVFFETGGDFNLSFDGEDPGNSANSDNTRLNASIPLRIGKGRIEPVEDARQAIYILDNLEKRKVLGQVLTESEIIEFAQLISTVKNKRFLDSRLRMIDEITAIDSFLVKNGLLASDGAPYFTTLYDFWMYGDLFKRGAGTEISGGLTGGLDYSYHKYETDDQKDTYPFLSADVSLSYEKPVNLFWQRSAFAKLFGSYGSQRTEIIDVNKNRVYSAGANGGYSWGYYPNSRTNLNMGINEYLTWDKTESANNDQVAWSNIQTQTNAFVKMYYYFSPQLRLSVEGSLGFVYLRILEPDTATDRDQTRWTGNFLATLTYSLF